MNRAIGIDIGGTKIAIALVAESGRVLGTDKLPTQPELGFEPALERIGAVIDRLLGQSPGEPIVGIGIGCAGPLDPIGGIIHNDFTLPSWGGRNIVEPLSRRFGAPASLENDADVALVGEAFAGAGRGHDSLVMLTFGTGVGGAVMSAGRIYRGANAEHPEIGHVPVGGPTPPCYCGAAGCLESIAAGPALSDAARAAGFPDAETLFARAKAGDPTARPIIDRAVQAAAQGVWILIHTFLPQRILFGGGIMEHHFDHFEPALASAIDRARLKPLKGMTLCRAELGNDAGVLGAAFVALRPALRGLANS